MNDNEIVELFRELEVPYPRAASGLIDDMCLELGRVLQETPQHQKAIDRLTDLIAQCFRPMDASWPPDSCPWDTAYSIFGRWLWRGLPHFAAAVESITNWDADRVAKCRAEYVDFVRYTRDDWVRAADGFEMVNRGEPTDARESPS
ncbi:hypothetical protein [Neorhodopirellula pilleata]|uniref:Uncharacterized protein n=1 Tax=Neorhodopirellula pilleata TaxID=2714738 RepID=A0A5C5YVQ8_9BACT|nr:hypothetical protein [Neorhodopirellula pilleata]TWT78597.1 hypothetical protein Pla100_63030 [Neorhodopirellula pilleata]